MFEYNLFRNLPSWAQLGVLQRQGSFLAQRQQKNWTVHLYSLHHVFYEVWQKDGIEIVTSFSPTSPALLILEPYMENIEVLMSE